MAGDAMRFSQEQYKNFVRVFKLKRKYVYLILKFKMQELNNNYKKNSVFNIKIFII